MEDVCRFPDLPARKQLTYQAKQLIAREIELEKMRRMEALLQARNLSEVRRGRAGVGGLSGGLWWWVYRLGCSWAMGMNEVLGVGVGMGSSQSRRWLSGHAHTLLGGLTAVGEGLGGRLVCVPLPSAWGYKMPLPTIPAPTSRLCLLMAAEARARWWLLLCLWKSRINPLGPHSLPPPAPAHKPWADSRHGAAHPSPNSSSSRMNSGNTLSMSFKPVT